MASRRPNQGNRAALGRGGPSGLEYGATGCFSIASFVWISYGFAWRRARRFVRRCTGDFARHFARTRVRGGLRALHWNRWSRACRLGLSAAAARGFSLAGRACSAVARGRRARSGARSLRASSRRRRFRTRRRIDGNGRALATARQPYLYIGLQGCASPGGVVGNITGVPILRPRAGWTPQHRAGRPASLTLGLRGWPPTRSVPATGKLETRMAPTSCESSAVTFLSLSRQPASSRPRTVAA